MPGNPNNDNNPIPKPFAIALICIVILLLSLFFFGHRKEPQPIPDVLAPPTLPALLSSSLSLPDLLAAGVWGQAEAVHDGPVESYQFTPDGQFSHQLSAYALPTKVTVGTWTLDGQTLTLTPVKYDYLNTGAPGTLVFQVTNPTAVGPPYPLMISDDLKTLTNTDNTVFRQRSNPNMRP